MKGHHRTSSTSLLSLLWDRGILTRRDLVAGLIGAGIAVLTMILVRGVTEPTPLHGSTVAAAAVVSNNNNAALPPKPTDLYHSSSITLLDTVPERLTSHGTKKQQLVEGFTVHPQLAGIAVATLRPGQSIERHVHPTMHEFFYVLQGELSMTVFEAANPAANEEKVNRNYTCRRDCFLHAVPGEPHEFTVRSDAQTNVQMLVIQIIATPDSIKGTNTSV